MLLREITQSLLEEFPSHYAETWDPIGLHFGSLDQPVQRLLVALDVRPEVVQEAIDQKVDAIIVHHPPIFKSIERFDLSNPQIQMYAELIKHSIAVFALHTNLDRAPGGMNDWLAQALGLEGVTTWSDPDHPSEIGLGRIGRFRDPLSRREVIARIKEAYDLETVTTIEREEQANYETVALIGGSGSSLLDTIQALGVDLFITGDFTFHTGQDAYELDFLTVDAGHYIEHIFNHEMTRVLESLAKTHQWPVEIMKSTVNTNPFKVE